MVEHPAGWVRSSSFSDRSLLPSGLATPWASGIRTLRGCIPTAHILARLRIAAVVTHAVARLATNLRDCALVGRASHPLDGVSEFQVSSEQFLPFRPAFPGRNRHMFIHEWCSPSVNAKDGRA